MAKTLYFRDEFATSHRGTNTAKLAGAASFWTPRALGEARGSGAVNILASSIAGTTVGIEFTGSPASAACEFISEPLSADFTIAGTITGNMWASESTMSDNTAINFVVDKIDGATGAITQIVKSARIVECAVTTPAVNNFTVTPTSTACKRGDRIRIRPFIDDIGSAMIVGTTTFRFNGPTAAASGDSYITFTENLTFELPGMPDAIVGPAPGAGNSQIGTTNFMQSAQRFTATSDSLSQITAYLFKQNSPTDNLIVEIQSDSAGIPSGSVVASIATIAGTSLTTTSTLTTWSTPISLTKGTSYWLVFRRSSGTADTVNNYLVKIATPTDAALATYWLHNGTSWIIQSTGLVMSVSFSFANAISTYYLTDTAETAVSSPYVIPAAIPLSMGDAAARTRTAQSFVAGGTLQSLALRLGKSGSPTDNLVIEVQSDSSGSPSGTVVGTIATVAGSSLSTATLQTYSVSISLTSGTTYWIVLRRTGAVNASNYYLGDASFPGYGVMKEWSGSAWVTNASLNVSLTIAPGNITEKKALTTRGSGSVNAVTNTATGPTVPIQITASGGGTAVEWFTPSLDAFTLGGKALMNLRGYVNTGGGVVSFYGEIAVCNADGSGAVVWGATCIEADWAFGEYGQISSVTDWFHKCWVSGDATAVTAGQRLRFRVYIDDTATVQMNTGFTATVSYNGTSAAAAGDTYVILPVAVTEQSVGGGTEDPMAYIGGGYYG